MSIYDYSVKNRSGEDISISQFKGKVLLIVNTATGCGFTPQYEGLEKLYKKYHEQGLEILDFPCNQFGNQAPGNDNEIHEFCTLKYNTSFDQFAKIDVNGENESPLFTFIKQQSPEELVEGMKNKMTMKAIEKISTTAKNDKDIKWNFTKFLVDREGNVVYRFSPTYKPEDIEEKIKEFIQGGKQMKEQLNLVQEWDKTFPLSDKVNHRKVTFHNRFGITLAADLYEPKDAEGKLPAIAVSGPFGAVKEQCSGLYAMNMAERGFLCIAFDPSYTGESTGTPRYVASPDINTEDFQAAVDFLSVQENVDPEKIGIIGICGWGGLALNVASIDTRIKATVATTMYNMSRVNHNGYFDSTTEDDLYELKKELNAQRIKDYKNGEYELGGGVVDPLPEDAPFFVKDYYDYYKTPRGYHERSLNSNGGWNKTSSLSFINTPQHTFTSEIRNAVLIIHGEKAHSCYFSKDAYSDMIKNGKYTENKELMIIPDAVHTDLYDRVDIIPFDKMESFFREYLK